MISAIFTQVLRYNLVTYVCIEIKTESIIGLINSLYKDFKVVVLKI